jgi:hypothetical protein
MQRQLCQQPSLLGLTTQAAINISISTPKRIGKTLEIWRKDFLSDAGQVSEVDGKERIPLCRLLLSAKYY